MTFAVFMLHSIIQRVRKKRETKMSFCNISYKTPAILMKYGTVSRINLLQHHVNVFHLTWIMSLHYLVKCKMLIAHMIPPSC